MPGLRTRNGLTRVTVSGRALSKVAAGPCTGRRYRVAFAANHGRCGARPLQQIVQALIVFRTTLSILVLGAVLSGCDNSRTKSASRPAPELPAVALDTPEAAARCVLTGLQAELRAVASGDQELAQAALEQLRSMVAAEAIEKRLNRMPQFEGLLGADLIAGYIRNWGSTIAYYAEGFRFERMRRVTDTPAKVSLVVPASGPADDALIQVTCLRQDDGTWRVSRIEFVGETTTTAPVSQPAPEP